MKTLALVFALLGTSFWAQAQDAPEAVKKTFAAQYPRANAGKWAKQGDQYVTHIKWDDAQWDVAIDANGKWLRSEKKISASEVTEDVKAAVKERQAEGWKISRWAELQSPEFTLAYEAVVKKGNEEKAILYAPSGKVLGERKP